jgi:DNA-binding NtrC family response regulator
MGRRTLRVLVVEDEKLIRWAVRETLAKSGHIVLDAPDAASARWLVQHAPAPPDVVLLDYRLPDSSGFQLLDDLQRLSPQTAVVMMTAQNDPALTSSALDHGARRVLDKPFDLNALDGVVRDAAAA